MPKYKSVDGKWMPVDEGAKEECKRRGVDALGANYITTNNSGVQAVATFPKVATGKWDGTQIAEPTPTQKIKISKKEK
jgi:hypothetical protein